MQTQAHKGYRVAAGLMLGVIALTGIGASISRRGAGARSEGSAAEMPDAGVAAPITAPPEKAFRVCGQYCGDNWCSGQKIKESDCALLPELAEPEHCYDRAATPAMVPPGPQCRPTIHPASSMCQSCFWRAVAMLTRGATIL